MNLFKIRFYIELLTIAAIFVAIPWRILIAVAGIKPLTPEVVATWVFCLAVMFTMNQTWKDLLEKWKGGGKR